MSTAISLEPSLTPITDHERELFAQIRNYQRIVGSLYHQKDVEAKVRELVPWKELTVASVEKMLQRQKSSGEEGRAEVNSRDLFLVELFDWFKNSFFSWFDSAYCSNDGCSRLGEKMSRSTKRVVASEEDVKWGASRVELYECPSCRSEFRFPRYNHPLKLLQTKTGRCGEWANCITCICTALGYESRLVIDWTDHVWSEVFSESQNRWVHCDSCENGIDSPLVYEVGWGKKLVYCMALSRDEVQDVTWRYTRVPDQVMSRRSLLCREEFVTSLITRVNIALQANLTEERRQQLTERKLRELIEFIWIPNQKRETKKEELQGRQSGSTVWRLARNEMGSGSEIKSVNFVFKPTQSDKSNGLFKVTYSCVKDEYKYGNNSLKGWKSGVSEFKNVSRKTEHDWKMVYLARSEGSESDCNGILKWEVDLESVASWSEVTLLFLSQEYESGCVQVTLHSKPDSNHAQDIPTNEQVVIKRNQLPENSRGFTLRATLSGASGSLAWQKAQLFRQSMVKDADNDCLQIIVKLVA